MVTIGWGGRKRVRAEGGFGCAANGRRGNLVSVDADALDNKEMGDKVETGPDSEAPPGRMCPDASC